MDYQGLVDALYKKAEKQAQEKGVSVLEIMHTYQVLYDIMLDRLQETINKDYKKQVNG